MKNIIKTLTQPVSDIVFPPVCACCGDRLIDRGNTICMDCLHSRFEPARTNKVILPDSVSFLLPLWSFDKYGFLQDLLHKLKYDHCTGVGEQIGREAGRLLTKSGFIDSVSDWRILAVPLHRKRYRTRGFNQSMEMAKGAALTSGIQLLSDDVVRRVKHTKTQTGLNSSERASNISGAFEITRSSAGTINQKRIVIVDDVFTTGATTFELSETLESVTGSSCGVLTIAMA